MALPNPHQAMPAGMLWVAAGSLPAFTYPVGYVETSLVPTRLDSGCPSSLGEEQPSPWLDLWSGEGCSTAVARTGTESPGQGHVPSNTWL